MHHDVYVVYDSSNRVIDLYVSYTWAKRKSKESVDYRVETYIHPNDRLGIESAAYSLRNRNY